MTACVQLHDIIHKILVSISLESLTPLLALKKQAALLWAAILGGPGDKKLRAASRETRTASG